MTLRPAQAQDLAFIRQLAGRPENAPFLTDEDETALTVYLTGPTSRLLIWGAEAPRGFALFCDVDNPAGAVNLMRLALDRPGAGEGRAFVRALIDHAFGPLQARRLWLDATGENTRAHRVYLRAGFSLEGRLRAHEFRPATGRVTDVVLFGLLRSEWQAMAA